MNSGTTTPDLLDFHPSTDSFHDAVVSGLSERPKTLPCKYLYDAKGSELFDRICELEEYYLTRVEQQIMEANIVPICSQLGTGVMLVEYGSGSSVKTRALLDHLDDAAAYVPVDISRDHLRETSRVLQQAYPQLEVLPVCADFTQPFSLPNARRNPSHVAVYFPGSTIGNFTPEAAKVILRQIADLVGVGGGLLIGIDLQKSAEVLESAYDDREGVTAEFNRNLLSRIDRELDADLDVDGFTHRARYDAGKQRVELSLVSQRDQTVRVGEQSFRFDEGEPIVTEHSHKYTVDGFTELAAEAKFDLHHHWIDADQRFAVLHLVVESD